MEIVGEWTDSEQAMKCITMPEGWNDVVSSVAVYRNSQGFPAKGHWESYTATESIDFTYHLGLSYNESKYTKESIEASLKLDMHAGVEFEGLGFSADISAELTGEIETETKKVFNESISVD